MNNSTQRSDVINEMVNLANRMERFTPENFPNEKCIFKTFGLLQCKSKNADQRCASLATCKEDQDFYALCSGSESQGVTVSQTGQSKATQTILSPWVSNLAEPQYVVAQLKEFTEVDVLKRQMFAATFTIINAGE